MVGLDKFDTLGGDKEIFIGQIVLGDLFKGFTLLITMIKNKIR